MVSFENYHLRPFEIPYKGFNWATTRHPSFLNDDAFSRMDKAFRKEMDALDRVIPRLEESHRTRKHYSKNEVQLSEFKDIATVSHEGDKYVMRLQAQDFQPEEIVVKVLDGYVVIDAEKEVRDEDHGSYRYHQTHERFSLPATVNPDQVTCEMTKQGVLEIQAPLPALVQHEPARRIAIKHSPQVHFDDDVPPMNKDSHSST